MMVENTGKLSIKKVAIVGPECTGKTSLAQALANHYKTEWVPEYARGYLEKLVRSYEQYDLLTIAQGQMRIEDEFARDANRVLICDTNLLVVKVWSEFKYQTCDPWIVKEMATRTYDLHLLMQTDVAWQADPQREHPDKRDELYAIYKRELDTRNAPYREISGTESERLQRSIQAIDSLNLA